MLPFNLPTAPADRGKSAPSPVSTTFNVTAAPFAIPCGKANCSNPKSRFIT